MTLTIEGGKRTSSLNLAQIVEPHRPPPPEFPCRFPERPTSR